MKRQQHAVVTTRFGLLEPDAEHTLSFPWGLPGLEDCREFVLLEPKSSRPLCWLQSLERPDVALPCLEPWTLKPDYEVLLSTADSAALQLTDALDAAVLVVLNLSRPVGQRTVNLGAPIVINVSKRIGRQVLMDRSSYGLREPLARLLGDQVAPAAEVP